jgi:hypothetical protein
MSKSERDERSDAVGTEFSQIVWSKKRVHGQPHVEQGASLGYDDVTGQKRGPANPFEEHHHFSVIPKVA